MTGIFRRRDVAESAAPERSGVVGTARVDERTKDLVAYLQAGEVAVIDHEDLDRIAAEGLVRCQPVAVLNAAVSSTGRYPNEGPLVLLEAGIPLVDDLGPELMRRIADGDRVVVSGGSIALADEPERVVLEGRRQSTAAVRAVHLESRSNMGGALNSFVENTVEFIDANRDILDDEIDVPDLGRDWHGRQVLLVVRGNDYREDLLLLRQMGYVREVRPVLLAVDGGADALIELGMRPDVIIGDMDSVSDDALRCGAQLVVHGYRDGRAPGAERLRRLGLDHAVFTASGTSEDVAMLLAYGLGAELIVAVGTHSSMVDFLDKGRAGMASTMLTRMKVGPVLVDAKGVSRLYQGRLRKRDLAMLVLAALFAMIVVVLISEPIRLLIRANWVLLTGFVVGGGWS
ncbi:MAG: putative cytokinetic ring protein SteA [Microthrixaceae bacterium]